jgi:hypothetical protein
MYQWILYVGKHKQRHINQKEGSEARKPMLQANVDAFFHKK